MLKNAPTFVSRGGTRGRVIDADFNLEAQMSLRGSLLLATATTMALSAAAAAQCPGSEDCCATHTTPGCSDQACCDFICLIDPFCCNVSWDGLCVQQATQFCAVCGGTPVECPPNENDCCVPSPDFTPGCSDAACCLLVCLQDSFCCEIEWDADCAERASITCGACPYPCPDNPFDSCFEPHAQPGCNDPECCSIVCGMDPFCCQFFWDGLCVSEALTFCTLPPCPFECKGTDEGEPCGDDTNGGCNSTSSSKSTCCFASGGIGCDDPDCTTAVCSIDPFCCEFQWDFICASEALVFCPDTCPVEYLFRDIACGETVCATAWASNNVRDTDWYQITLTQEPGTLIRFSAKTTLPLVIGLVDTDGVADCQLASFLNPFAVVGFCGEGAVEICLAPGTYWFFAAPLVFDGFPCGRGNNDYSVTLECLGECVPPACGNVENDCQTPSLTPFCSDEACCQKICGLDPFCCNVSWDDLCVLQAQVTCYGVSICPPSDHDCCAVGSPGCTDEDCCNTVCAVDFFCCLSFWDAICVSEAIQLCGAPKCPPYEACTGTDEGEPCGQDTNGGCNMMIPTFSPIACGDTICGLAWADGGTRDTDWYEIVVTEPTEMTMRLSAELPMVFGVIDTGGIPNCALAQFINPFASTGCCGDGELTFTLNPGTWWLFAGPLDFFGTPCDTTNRYTLSLSCGCDAAPDADFNDDGCVNGSDLGELLGQWGTGGGNGFADFNCDGVVDGNDLGTLLGEWGGSCG